MNIISDRKTFSEFHFELVPPVTTGMYSFVRESGSDDERLSFDFRRVVGECIQKRSTK